jgi:excisionase family DNA binding protein
MPMESIRQHPALQRPASPEEIANLLNVHKQTILRAIRNKRLRAYKAGGKTIRVLPADLLAWLEKNANLPRDGSPCDIEVIASLFRLGMLPPEKATFRKQ